MTRFYVSFLRFFYLEHLVIWGVIIQNWWRSGGVVLVAQPDPVGYLIINKEGELVVFISFFKKILEKIEI